TLIGATTENPFFEVNKALVSRSRLFRLQPLEPADLRVLLERTLSDAERGYGDRTVAITPEAVNHLVDVAGGDARSLLNALELAVETTPAEADGTTRIDLAIAEESIQQRAVLYDKQGDAHFDTISAFIKSLRGSDPDAALFWLARMVEAGENPRFIFRRMLISAGEDVGLADPQAMVVVEACAAAFERVGLPEGLYPLALASLYLAGCEKSNSTLGFFDAVKAVRQANRQQVPAHLRDAHRDGRAFGDGVGYRYPHAYAEHWVAQQYLPTALQGEVFWQPGSLGWEGRLRQRLQQRRAAQLAAVAETAAEQPELLSSSPEDPQLTRWLQRQAVAEGERLDRLRKRFWEHAAIGRLDRVLVLDARSLLWALDPLEAASEGEVVITVSGSADRERLEAQLQVLDALRRPRLLQVPLRRPGDLAAALGADWRFEWLAGRQPLRGLSAKQRRRWLEALTLLAAPGARARFLFSRPRLGPAASLREQLRRQRSGARRTGRGPAGKEALALLEEVVALEEQWLGSGEEEARGWQEDLGSLGWAVAAATWRESLELPIDEALLRRWFAPEAPYRQRLAGHFEAAGIEQLAHLLEDLRGTSLPQPIDHALLEARLGDGSRSAPVPGQESDTPP
ncbi:MAG: AAA family ATPase, partial [Synechococcaceae cyanobacterium]|nr:AAA family ATPase [Synechococcaceae cyanobacterium]